MGMVRNSIVKMSQAWHIYPAKPGYSRKPHWIMQGCRITSTAKDSGAVEFWHVTETLPLLKKLAL